MCLVLAHAVQIDHRLNGLLAAAQLRAQPPLQRSQRRRGRLRVRDLGRDHEDRSSGFGDRKRWQFRHSGLRQSAGERLHRARHLAPQSEISLR
jgi:hypothetical protein